MGGHSHIFYCYCRLGLVYASKDRNWSIKTVSNILVVIGGSARLTAHLYRLWFLNRLNEWVIFCPQLRVTDSYGGVLQTITAIRNIKAKMPKNGCCLSSMKLPIYWSNFCRNLKDYKKRKQSLHDLHFVKLAIKGSSYKNWSL